MTDQLNLFAPNPAPARKPVAAVVPRSKPEDDAPQTPTVDANGNTACPHCGTLYEDPTDVGWHWLSRGYRCVGCKPARGPLLPEELRR